jgi:hypothetical protein
MIWSVWNDLVFIDDFQLELVKNFISHYVLDAFYNDIPRIDR